PAPASTRACRRTGRPRTKACSCRTNCHSRRTLPYLPRSREKPPKSTQHTLRSAMGAAPRGVGESKTQSQVGQTVQEETQPSPPVRTASPAPKQTTAQGYPHPCEAGPDQNGTPGRVRRVESAASKRCRCIFASFMKGTE